MEIMFEKEVIKSEEETGGWLNFNQACIKLSAGGGIKGLEIEKNQRLDKKKKNL